MIYPFLFHFLLLFFLFFFFSLSLLFPSCLSLCLLHALNSHIFSSSFSFSFLISYVLLFPLLTFFPNVYIILAMNTSFEECSHSSSLQRFLPLLLFSTSFSFFLSRFILLFLCFFFLSSLSSLSLRLSVVAILVSSVVYFPLKEMFLK